VKWFSPTDQYVTRVPAHDLREGGATASKCTSTARSHAIPLAYREELAVDSPRKPI
jgi:hypothetical protein